MAELADAIDLGSIVNRRAGSSPVIRINHNIFKIIIKELKTIDFTGFPALFVFVKNQNICFLCLLL